MGRAAVVDLAGGDEKVHAVIVEREVSGCAELECQFGSARSVFRVAVFVLPAGIVEEGEQPDDFRIGLVVLREVETISADGEPMGGTMDGTRTKAESGGDQLPEWEFDG